MGISEKGKVENGKWGKMFGTLLCRWTRGGCRGSGELLYFSTPPLLHSSTPLLGGVCGQECSQFRFV
jgi:hypothetical protein